MLGSRKPTCLLLAIRFGLWAVKREVAVKLSKGINILAFLLLGCLACVTFMIMSQTAESNSITVDVAKYQSEKESKVVMEMRMMTLEMRNLQKEVGILRDTIGKK